MTSLPPFASSPRKTRSNVSRPLSALLGVVGFSFLVTTLVYIRRETILENERPSFPCWAEETSRQRTATLTSEVGSHVQDVFKCTGPGLNHTIQSHEELSLDGGQFNTPWFHAASKLSLCWIPKVGCSKTKMAWAYLTGVIYQPDIHRHHPPSIHYSKLTVDDLNHVFSSDDWLNVVIVRDPLERFISGYLDKVWNTGWFNPNRTNFDLTALSIQKFLRHRQTMKSDHFAPQSNYCGLRQLGSAWNRLVIYSRNGMREKLSEASDGRLDAVLNGPGDLPSSQPIFTSGTKHETGSSQEYRTMMTNLCCSDFGNEVLDEIVAFFREDYDRFPFQTQDWRTTGICDPTTLQCTSD